MEVSQKQRQLIWIGALLAVIGLVFSAYSLQHHLDLRANGSTDAFCNINQTFSCDDIARSEYSEDPYGNPLGIYGIGYFLGLLVLLGVANFSSKYRNEALHGFGFLVGSGVLISIVLGIIAFAVIGAVCLTCLGIYFVCFMLAAVTWFSKDALPAGWTFKSISNGSSYMLITVLVVITVFQFLQPNDSPQLTKDEARTVGEIEKMVEQLEQRKKELQRNLELLKVDRSPYSGSGEDYRKGSDEAKVVIVKFADFQCSHCSQAASALKQLYAEFGDQIQVVYKNFPLSKDCNDSMQQANFPYTCQASTMARCAGRYGKFWQMHDKMFENQSRIDPSRLELWALEIGLTKEQIEECKASPDILAKIKADASQGSKLGIRGTPSVYLNGVNVDATDLDAMRFQINNALRR